MEQSQGDQELQKMSSVHFEIEDPVSDHEDYELKASAYEEVVQGFARQLEAEPQSETFRSGGREYPIQTPLDALKSNVQQNLRAAEENLQNIRSQTT